MCKGCPPHRPTRMSDEGRVIGEKLAPFNPTSVDVVRTALAMLRISSGDVVYDLGCGDARFLIAACRQVSDIKCIGVEYDSAVYERALTAVAQVELGSQITLLHDNVLNVDFSNANIIFVYLVPEGIRKIRDRLLQCLRKGARIVTYVFSIPEVVPTKVELYKGSTKIYLYSETIQVS